MSHPLTRLGTPFRRARNFFQRFSNFVRRSHNVNDTCDVRHALSFYKNAVVLLYYRNLSKLTIGLKRGDMKSVYFDNDAGVDDLLSVILLLSMKHIKVLGLGVTPADCYLETGLPATLKILELLQRADIPVAGGTLEGRHAFPHEWRRHSHIIDALPMLNENGRPRLSALTLAAHELLIETVRASRQPVTLLFTGPLTNLAAALDQAPDIEPRIERLYWMGGAVDVPGNVLPPDGDGSAEWNVYWDAMAAARVWRSSVPITLVSLDATNHVPVSIEFLRRLAKQRKYMLSDLAGQCWAITVNSEYYFWDTLTTLAVGFPDLVPTRDVPCQIVTDGPSEGRTQRAPGGRVVQMADAVDAASVYDTVLALLKQ